jgi:23S rRNA (cytidine1920-2'-O)/16S rRNA (cytidine1409-2'-O)-methyltransferase
MTKTRLDTELVARGLVPTRSQAESYIRLGQVTVNKQVVTKPGAPVSGDDVLHLTATEQYVSRAGLKLASVARALKLNFKNTVVLDVGSSTGGFTDYALRHGARKVIAVDVGTNQLHPSLRINPSIELFEQTDIRDVTILSETPDIVVIDVSFISLREILPAVARLSSPRAQVVAMVKPQFEAGAGAKHSGVIKNDRMRRDILKSFEEWARGLFVILDKADSEVSGAKGNLERFYLLKVIK